MGEQKTDQEILQSCMDKWTEHLNKKTPRASEHTKGPWEWSTGDPDLNNYGVYSNAAKERIAEVLNQSSANARLIAAAPELLESLQGLHKALTRMIDKHDPDSIEAEWLSHSHEAIAKATK